MTKQTISIGSGELAGDGESIRSAFVKVNANFDEIYAGGIGGGVSGPTGPSGATGPQGNVGLTGPSGVNGSTGPQGPSGATGPQGNAGAVGPTGPSGAQGNAGATGPQGIQGDVGPSGPSGAQGNAGVTGPTGPQGVQGPQGVAGENGAVGPTGPQGNTGISGPAGPAGASGDPGAVGPTGPQGDPGPRGLTGDQGVSIVLLGTVTNSLSLPLSANFGEGYIAVDTGRVWFWGTNTAWNDVGQIVGPQGDIGDPGPAGATGDPGSVGPTGPQGDPGPTGPQGERAQEDRLTTGSYSVILGTDGTITLTTSSNALYTTTNALIKSIADIQISAGDDVGSNWTFGGNGTLTAPGDIVLPYGTIGSGTLDGIKLTTDRGTVLFGNTPECVPTVASHFHIMRDDPTTVDLFFGDDLNYVKLPYDSTLTNVGVQIGTDVTNLWSFGKDGALTAPGHILPDADLEYDLGSTSSQWRSIYVGTGTIYIGGVALGVNQDNYVTVDGNPLITVNTTGNLTVQGDTNIVLGAVIISDTAPAATTPGSQWFDTVEGRTYVATGGVWLDASPTQIPSPETYLDGLAIDGTVISTANVDSDAIVIDGGDNTKLSVSNNSVTIQVPSSGVIRPYWAAEFGGITTAVTTSSYTIGTGAFYDSVGNVYVLGGVLFGDGGLNDVDSLLLKYDTNGNLLWSRTWHDNSGANCGAVNQAFAIDSNDRIYWLATAVVSGFGCWSGYMDTDGNLGLGGIAQGSLGFVDGYVSAVDIACDNSGNYYLAGSYYDNISYSTTPVVIKIDGDSGTPIWTGNIIPEDFEDLPVDGQYRAVTVNPATGDVWAIGDYYDGGLRAMLSKWDINGIHQWTKELVTTTGDLAAAVIYNGGYVYTIVNDDPDQKAVVSKFDTDGDLIWASYLATGELDPITDGGPGSYSTGAYDLSFDASGNVYVTGTIPGPPVGQPQLWITKLNPANGEMLYSRILITDAGVVIIDQGADGGGSSGHRVGDIYQDKIAVTAVTSSDIDDSTGTNETRVLVAQLPIDGSVTGTFGNITIADLTSDIDSISSTGTYTVTTLTWSTGTSTAILSTSSLSVSYVTDIVGLTGETLALGSVSGSSTVTNTWTFVNNNIILPPGGDILDSNGVSVLGGGSAASNVWVQTFESATPLLDTPLIALSVEYDSVGNVIALFYHGEDSGGSFYSVGKYTTSGTRIWTTRFSTGYETDGWGLAVDPTNGFIYVAGKTNTDGGQEKSTLTKIASGGGSVEWSKTYAFGESINSNSQVVDVASDGNPVMVGYTFDNLGGGYVTTTKVDAEDGSIIWSKKLDGQDDEEAYGMAVGPTGEVVAVGYMDQLGGEGDTDNHMLVVKYLSDGTIDWQRAILFDEGYDSTGADADIDSEGNVYVCGQYEVDNAGPGICMNLVKFNSAGVKQWSRRVEGDCGAIATSIVVGADDKLYLSGSLFTTTVPNPGPDDPIDISCVVAKYNLDGTVVWQRLLDNIDTLSVSGSDFLAGQGGGSNLAVKQDYVALAGGFGSFEGPSDFHALIAQLPATGDPFAVGAWDFRASNLTGTLDTSASDITVVNADKTDTDNTSNITVATVTPIVDSSAFLIGTLYTGDSTTALGDRLVNNDAEFILESDGTLTLNDGATISSGMGAFRIEPAGASSATQALLIYPTVVDGNHIHLTAGFGGETDLYLGNDDQFVKIDHGGDIVVGTYSTVTNSTWTFGTDGELEFPQGSTISETNTTTIISPPGASAGQSLVIRPTGSTSTTETNHIHLISGNPTTVDLFLGDDDQYVKIEKNGGNIVVQTYSTATTSTWVFGTDGVLTLSTASTILGNNSDPNVYIETASTSTAINTWTFAADGGLTLPNGATIVDTTSTLVLTPNSPGQATSLVLRSTYNSYMTADYPTDQGYQQYLHELDPVTYPDPYVSTGTEGTVISITLWDASGLQYVQGDVEYIITGTGITAADFTPAVLTGTFAAANWTLDGGGFNYTNTNMLMIANDAIVEGEETFTVTIVTTGTYAPGAGSNYLRVNIVDGTTEGSESGHIHLISENMAQTSIFLGNDDKYVKVAADDQIYIKVPNVDTSATSQLWTFAGDGSLTLPDGGDIKNSSGTSVLTVVTGQETYEFDGVNTTLTITNVTFNLLFCTVVGGYSGSDGHTVVLPPGTAGQRLVIVNISSNCTLTVDGAIDGAVNVAPEGTAELIYLVGDGVTSWWPLYGTTLVT